MPIGNSSYAQNTYVSSISAICLDEAASEKLIIDNMETAIERFVGEIAPDALDDIKNNRQSLRDNMLVTHRLAKNQTLNTDALKYIKYQFNHTGNVVSPRSASGCTHNLIHSGIWYHGEYGDEPNLSMTKLFEPDDMKVITRAISVIDNACYVISENSPASMNQQLKERNEYTFDIFGSAIKHIKDDNKADDRKRLAVLNLLTDTILNIDQTLYELCNLMCTGTETNLEKVIRPYLVSVSEDLLMFRDHIESKFKK